MACLRKRRDERMSGMQQVIVALDELNLDMAANAPVDSVRRRTVPSIRPPLDSRVVRRKKQRRRWWTYAMLGAFALGVALVLLYDRLSSRGNHPVSPVPSSALVPATRNLPASANPAPLAGASRGQATTKNPTQRLSSPSVGSGPESKLQSKKARQLRTVERPDVPRPSRTEASAGVRDESFGVESAPGSSEIGNPWPQ